MSSPNHPVLQRFYRLNGSSSDFYDQLNKIHCGQEYKQCVTDLQGDDLIWLVDYLDKVCHHVAPPHPLLELA